MAAAAASLSSFSSLAIGSRTFSTVNYRHSLSPTVRAPTAKPSHPSLYSLHSNSTRFNPIQATPEDIDPDSDPKIDLHTKFYDSFEEAGDNITFDPPETPEVFVQSPDYEDEPIESEEEIAAAYEDLYGPAYSGQSVLGNDIYVMDSKRKKSTRSKGRTEKIRDGFEEVVVQVRRVTKVVKGGKQMNFRVVVVVGDKQGKVGVGVGKATEVVTAVQKSAIDARRNIVTVRMTKYSTFPHRADGKFGAAKVMLRPAAPGTGVIAGGSVRIVLEMAGVENALGKQLGSDNALNNARATVVAVQKMRHFSEVAEDRGIPMQELWK